MAGLDNQIVWGLPHVFAIFMIVSASGALNIGSMASVFGQTAYKPHAPLSGLLAIALLAGGLAVLVLDLGRPDRLMVAATNINPTSVFAWNVLLYSGFFALVAAYLWCLMGPAIKHWSTLAGIFAFTWRFILTTGTGCIFGFLVARQAYQSALLAPLFIVFSLAWGLAAFLLVQAACFAWKKMTLPSDVAARLMRLLGIFVLASLYLVAVLHLTHAYYARQQGFEYFILFSGAPFPLLFWVGYVLLGSLIPLGLLWTGAEHTASLRRNLSAFLVILGAFAQLYVFIVGGQSFPLELFPGFTVSSSFADGQINAYTPNLHELVLGLGGLLLCLLIVALGVRVLHFLPQDNPKTTP